jgi:hypothetical protein
MKAAKLPIYLGLLQRAEENLIDALIMVADRHDREVEVRENAKLLAAWSRWRLKQLQPFIERYGIDKSKNDQAQRLFGALFHGPRVGGTGLLADLQDLQLMATQVDALWSTIWQVGKGAHDRELEMVADEACKSGDRQINWLHTQTRIVAPQAIIVPSDKESEIVWSQPKKPTPSSLQDMMWAPLTSGAIMLLVGVVALVVGWVAGLPAGYPWLFPSLGPTAYLQAEDPANPASRFYNTVVGHMVGLGAGFAAVFVTNSYFDPLVLVAHVLTPGRMLAAVIALALTLLVALLLKASHPPAGATTLLVALGAFKIEDILTVVVGVLLVAAFGEVLRRMKLGEMTFRTERREQRVPAPRPQP